VFAGGQAHMQVGRVLFLGQHATNLHTKENWNFAQPPVAGNAHTQRQLRR